MLSAVFNKSLSSAKKNECFEVKAEFYIAKVSEQKPKSPLQLQDLFAKKGRFI